VVEAATAPRRGIARPWCHGSAPGNSWRVMASTKLLRRTTPMSPFGWSPSLTSGWLRKISGSTHGARPPLGSARSSRDLRICALRLASPRGLSRRNRRPSGVTQIQSTASPSISPGYALSSTRYRHEYPRITRSSSCWRPVDGSSRSTSAHRGYGSVSGNAFSANSMPSRSWGYGVSPTAMIRALESAPASLRRGPRHARGRPDPHRGRPPVAHRALVRGGFSGRDDRRRTCRVQERGPRRRQLPLRFSRSRRSRTERAVEVACDVGCDGVAFISALGCVTLSVRGDDVVVSSPPPGGSACHSARS